MNLFENVAWKADDYFSTRGKILKSIFTLSCYSFWLISGKIFKLRTRFQSVQMAHFSCLDVFVLLILMFCQLNLCCSSMNCHKFSIYAFLLVTKSLVWRTHATLNESLKKNGKHDNWIHFIFLAGDIRRWVCRGRFYLLIFYKHIYSSNTLITRT